MTLSESDLLHLLRIDLGLRSEFEAALRQRLIEYRRAPDPKLKRVELTVVLDLGDGIAED